VVAQFARAFVFSWAIIAVQASCASAQMVAFADANPVLASSWGAASSPRLEGWDASWPHGSRRRARCAALTM